MFSIKTYTKNCNLLKFGYLLDQCTIKRIVKYQLLFLLMSSLYVHDVSSQNLIERTQTGVITNIVPNGNETRIYDEIQDEIQHSIPTFDNLFVINNETSFNQLEGDYLIERPIYYSLNQSEFSNLQSTDSGLIDVSIPVNNEHSINLILKEFSITSETFEAYTNERALIDRSSIRTFRGYIKGDPYSQVSMTISVDNIRILISDNESNYSLGELTNNQGTFVLLDDSSLLTETPFNCGSDDSFIANGVKDELLTSQKSSSIGCVDIYIEVGNDVFNTQGGTEPSLFVTMSLFNETAMVFCNENIDIYISDVLIWTTSNPYGSQSSMADILYDFGSNVQNAFDGDLAHLLVNNSIGNVGGIAWIDFLGASYNGSCNTNNGIRPCGPYGVSSGVSSGINPFPNYSYAVTTFAHELGHNFGSQHTHACVWNGNNTAIDGCGPVGNCPNPGATTNGTIMSYCSNYPLTNGFGSQPGGLIRSRLNSAINNNLIDGSCSCSVPCPEDFVFTSYGATFPSNWSVQHPRLFGDVNGDGKDDIVGFANAGVRVALSTGSDLTSGSSVWSIAQYGPNAGGWNVNSHPRFVVDVNADGMDDIVGFAAAGVFVATSTGSSFNTPSFWINGYGISAGLDVFDNPRVPGDFDNDGFTDFVIFGNTKTAVIKSTGTAYVNDLAFDLAHFHRNQNWIGIYPRLVGDVDGDGFDDDIVGFGPNAVKVSKSNGTSFTTDNIWTTNFTASQGWSHNSHLRFLADVDGDGKDDAVGFASEGVRVGLSTGTSFSPQTSWIAGFGVNQGWRVDDHPRYVTDVNGDGMADILGFANAGVYVSYSTGTSFDTPVLLQSCYGFNDNWADIDYVRSHADFSGDGQREIVAMGCGGTYIHFSKNDDCSSARQLDISSVCNPSTGSNVGFSASGEFPEFSCGNSGATIDVWYKVEVPSSGNLILETTQVAGGLPDMVMQVLVGSCGSFTEIACNDDSGSGAHSMISLSGRTPGELLFIRIVEFASNSFGDFGICAHDDSPPVNCPPNYTGANQLTGTQSAVAHYETNGILQSDQIIDADVDYDSGTFIELLEGFEVQIGKVFQAFIDGCGNLFRDEDDSQSKDSSK